MEKNNAADVNSAKSMGALKSSVLLRCPHCHQGSLFVNPQAYTWTKIGEMNNECPHCHISFHNEVGFYFGAAYVSYALTVALWVSVLVALIVFDALGWIEFGFLTHPLKLLTVGCIATAVLFPYIFRLSRSIWAHFFIK
ncbi:MAG TPA: DUF983 domain-containing protein [Flavobacteriales bacterium]